MVEILPGSMPAPAMPAWRRPAVGCPWPPEPASHMISLPPVSTTWTVKGIETKSAVKPAAVIAPFTSSTAAFLMKAGSCGFSQMPS